jgi:alkanesulfonate monooxygenase SsuD/methylene tetrahydromethanopterin reductase-like flavin-dependent oxidoreductase (luciferase family)
MDIGIGLPATIPGIEGRRLLEWARRAEERGFSSLGVIDRLVYDNFEPLIALAAAASVTERVRLVTGVLLGPLRANPALFAKQAASVDRLSNGRLVLGLGVGGREDDFETSGLDIHQRGKQMDHLIEEAQHIWVGESRGMAGGIGPRPVSQGGPQLLLGGQSPASFRRAAKYGSGWIAGGGGPQALARGGAAARQAWAVAGRTDRPRLVGLAYFALGPLAKEHAAKYLGDYYAFAGPYKDMVVKSALTDENAVRAALAAFKDVECDELLLAPCDPDISQVNALASVALTSV